MTTLKRDQVLIGINLSSGREPYVPLLFMDIFHTLLEQSVRRHCTTPRIAPPITRQRFVTDYHREVGRLTSLRVRKIMQRIPHERVVQEAAATAEACHWILRDGPDAEKNLGLRRFLNKTDHHTVMAMHHTIRDGQSILVATFSDQRHAIPLPTPLKLAQGPVEVSVDAASHKSRPLTIMVEGYVDDPLGIFKETIYHHTSDYLSSQ